MRKALLLVCLQVLVPGSLADLVVKEKDIADLQLDQLQLVTCNLQAQAGLDLPESTHVGG